MSIKDTKQVRNTPQRQLVKKIIDESCDHPTADTVYKRVIAHDPKVSLGTVYRNLDFLSESGQILRIRLPSGPDHFDFNMTPHIHFYCTECLNISDMPDECVEAETKAHIPDPAGYDIKERFLLYIGTCPECNKKTIN